MDHRDREFAALDHDFCPLTHPRQHAREVAGSFRFRDVDDTITHDMIIALFLHATASLLPFTKGHDKLCRSLCVAIPTKTNFYR